MKLQLLALTLLTACASRTTVHEYCTANTAHYKDYDQCYAEESAHRENKRKAWATAFAPNQKRTSTCRQVGNVQQCEED